MLTACFDAAGKTEDKNTPVVVVAGFASRDGVWVEFDDRWSAVLKEYGIPFFHAGLFAGFKHPFSEWRHDEAKRRSLVADLLGIIQECGLRKFGALLRKKDLIKAKEVMGLETEPGIDHYVLCSRATLDDLYSYARGEGENGNLAAVFEKGDSEDKLKKHLKRHGLLEPDFRWSREVIDRKGITTTPFLGLQAAGWIVWEYYLDFCRVAGLKGPAPTDSGRVPFRAFEALPGHLKSPHLGNCFDDIRAQVSATFAQELNAVRASTERLERAKRSGS
jgi:hypothetical protein